MGAISLPVTSMVATPGPVMPPNVAAANQAMFQQPYWNQIIQLVQNPAASANTNNVLPVSQIAPRLIAGLKALPAQQQQAQLQTFQALASFLPTFLTNAAIMDAWDRQNNWGPPIPNYYTQMGQTAQSALSQVLSAFGMSAGGSFSAGSLPSWVWIIAGAAVLFFVMGGGDGR